MTIAGRAPDIARVRVVPLPNESAFVDFQCGEREIDRNLPNCCEWQLAHRCRVYCAYEGDNPTLYGFYCLGMHAHESKHVEGFFNRSRDDLRGFVPFIYINYLAVREGYRRRKIGTVLLMSALERCAIVIREIGAYGIALNALNDDAAALYDKYGFRAKRPQDKYPLMVLPARSVLELFPE